MYVCVDGCFVLGYLIEDVTSAPLLQMFELSVMIVNNTGLAVSPGGGALISSSNLTFATTAPGPQELDIRLEITDGPNYGKIQRLRSNGKWVTTRRFSQRQIEKEKIRYIHR